MASISASNRTSHVVSTQMTGGTIDWTIPKFSRLVDYLSGKPEFRSASSLSTKDSCSWYLNLASFGTNGRERIVLNLCREIIDSKNPACVCYGKLCFRWKFTILDVRGREIYFEGSDDFLNDATFKTHEIQVNYGGPVVYMSLPGDFIWNPIEGQVPLLQADTLNVRAQFEYVYSASSIQCTVPESDLHTSRPELDNEFIEDFSRMLHSKERPDFTMVSSDGRQFPVHRKILQQRSDYFAAMLTSDVKEAKTGRCALPDLDGKTVEILVAYMYSGVPKVHEDMVQQLLVTADKYQFGILKEYCESRLISRLTVGCAAHFLVMADKHSAPKLRDACMELITDGIEMISTYPGEKVLCTSDLMIESRTIDWTISKFSWRVSETGQLMSPGTLTHSPYTWCLMLKTGPATNGSIGRRVTVLLVRYQGCRPPSALTPVLGARDGYNGESTVVRWRLSVLDTAGNEIYHKGSNLDAVNFTAEEVNEARDGSLWIPVELPWDNFMAPPDGQPVFLQPGGELILRMSFEYATYPMDDYARIRTRYAPPLTGRHAKWPDISHLLKSGEGFDFVLVSRDGKAFRVHRQVLQERSEYYTAMLGCDGAEVREGQCRLPDVDAKCLELLLLFIYGGLETVPDGLVESVLIAADKYSLLLLKEHCEALLIGKLTASNWMRYRELADKFSAAKLQAACEQIEDGLDETMDMGYSG